MIKIRSSLLAVFACFYLSCASAVNSLAYKFSSFTVPDADAAADDLLRYSPGIDISDTPSSWLTTFATSEDNVRAIRLNYDNDNFADVYFVDGDNNQAAHFNAQIGASSTYAEDDWTWWQDWHLAYTTDDYDTVATRLFQDKHKFVNRGSIYIPLADSGVVLQVLSSTPATIYWTEPFLFCRPTTNEINGAMPYLPTNVTDVSLLPSPTSLPTYTPSHQSFPTTDAVASGMATSALFSFDWLHPEDLDSHPYSNGVCAKIQWLSDSSNFAVHFIEQYVKREGEVLVKDWENKLKTALSNMQRDNVDDSGFFNFRTAFTVPPPLSTFTDIFDSSNVDYVTLENKHVVLGLPSGYLIELYEQ